MSQPHAQSTNQHPQQGSDALKYLEESILHRRRALNLMPEGHPGRASCLSDLSQALRTRFERLGYQEDLQNALSAAREVAQSQAASSLFRLQGALLWASCCTLGSTSSFPAFGCAIELLPRIAWLGLVVDDQYTLLAEVGSVVRNAVAAAIAEDNYETAIEWAEQGRSVVWHNLLSLRPPLEELRTQHPALALRIQELSQNLERNALVEPGSSNMAHLGMAMQRDLLIDQVRNKPGLESFMKPKSFEELASATQGGAVVLVNLGDARCDALALLSDDNGAPHVVPIPLERVTLQSTQRLSEKLLDLLRVANIGASDPTEPEMRSALDNQNSVFKEVLQTLWLDYVQPIVNALGYSVDLDSPPRLWWCVTGPLAFLPIHAAGLYDTKEAGHKLSDYVISSYTPDFTALLDCSPANTHGDLKMLTVAISPPSVNSLRRVEEEAEKVQHLAANLATVVLKTETATREDVLKELEKSNWIHLACHQDRAGGKPMESGLVLHDGKLKLSDVVKIRVPNAGFAFLSADQTALGDRVVPEESAHLAAGMLFAGYRGVVATVWSIQDDSASRVAEEFYQHIFRHGQPQWAEAAYALHKAVRSLQEADVPIAAWVPFVHFGR